MKLTCSQNTGILSLAVILAVTVSFTSGLITASRAESGSALQAGTTQVDDEPAVDKSELRIAFKTGFNSKNCYQGMPIQATLKEDWKMGGYVIAPKGSSVLGHIDKSLPAGKMDKLRKKVPLKLSFTRIVTPSREQINIVAAPREQRCGFTNNREFREIVIGPRGELVKAASLHVLHNEDFEFGVPKHLIQFKGLLEISVLEGDELALEFNLSSNNPSLAHIRKDASQ